MRSAPGINDVLFSISHRSADQSGAHPHCPDARSKSAADWKRSAGSFARHRATTAATSAGTSGRRSVNGGGGSDRCAARTWPTVFPGNGGRPVKAKYRRAQVLQSASRHLVLLHQSYKRKVVVGFTAGTLATKGVPCENLA